MSAKFRIAVYGTLLSDKHNHATYLKSPDVTYVTDYEIPGYLMMEVWNGVPGIVPCSDPRMGVLCEIYDVDPSTLKKLDGLENIDEGMYRRATFTTPLWGKVMVYEMGPMTFKNIFRGGRELLIFKDGDYKSRDRWTLLRADLPKLVDHDYLRDAGLHGMVGTRTDNKVVSIIPEKPTEPPFNWKAIYGEIVAAKQMEVLRHAE